MNQTVLGLVQQGKEEEVNQLPLVKKYLALFKNNPQLYEEYIKQTDVFNPKKVKDKLQGLELASGEKKIIVMDDGSFIVLKSEDIPFNEAQTPLITPQTVTNSYHEEITVASGASRVHTTTQDYYGIYLTCSIQLTTNYRPFTNKITIDSNSTSGTKAIFPSSISPGTPTTSGNNSNHVTISCDYTEVSGINGNIGFTYVHNITSSFVIKSTSGNLVTYTVDTTVND